MRWHEPAPAELRLGRLGAGPAARARAGARPRVPARPLRLRDRAPALPDRSVRQARRFVLKGATLFRLWNDTRGRATWDLDLLGRGGSTAAEFAATIRELCLVPGEDGLVFDVATLATEDIRAGDEYLGVRLRLEAELAAARIPLQIDIGFGDSVVPPPRLEHFPTLLELALNHAFDGAG